MINRLLMFLLLTAAAVGQEIPELEAIKPLEAERRHKDAAIRCEKVIRQYPSRWEPYHAAAQNWGRIRRYRKAQTHLEMARQINPDVARVLFDLASVTYNQAKWAEARIYFHELQSLAGRDASAQGRWQVPYFSGVCAQKLEYVEEAIDAYNRAINMTTGDRQRDYKKELEIRNRLAGTMLNSGRTEGARHHFARLAAMQPNSGEFHYFLGVCHLKLGQLDDAEKALLEARRRQPDDFRTHLRLGKVYRRQEDLLKAQSFFQLAAEKNPQAYEPWYALRQIYTQTNNLDEADKAHAKYEEFFAKGQAIEEKLRGYRRRVKIDPYDRQAYFEHGMLLIENQRLPEGMDQMLLLLAIEPSHELAIINVAQIIATQNDFQGAVHEMDKILERDPGHPIANFESARSLLRLGDLQAAYPRLLRCFGRMDKDKTPKRYILALKMWAAVAANPNVRRPADPLPEFKKALEHWASNRTHLGEIIETYGVLCAAAQRAAAFYRAAEDVLPVLGEEHPKYKPVIELLIKVAHRANDEAVRKKYEGIYQTLQ